MLGAVDVCSSHGRCLSMQSIAEFSDNNGDAGGYTYGLQSYLNSTWDHGSMWGCFCDEGWHGYDCSLSKFVALHLKFLMLNRDFVRCCCAEDCPTGDDPHSPGVPAIQLLQCKATGGYFTLSFRQYTTEHILYNDDFPTLKRKLEALHTIHGVTITATTAGATVCGSPSATNLQLTFMQDFGALPSLKIVENALTGVRRYRLVYQTLIAVNHDALVF